MRRLLQLVETDLEQENYSIIMQKENRELHLIKEYIL